MSGRFEVAAGQGPNASGLSAEEIEALNAARTMTPLTLHMVVATMIAVHVSAAVSQGEGRLAAIEALRVSWAADKPHEPAGDYREARAYAEGRDDQREVYLDDLTAALHPEAVDRG